MTTQIARHWRLKAQRYRLVGNVCPDCARTIFSPRKVCPHCAEKAEKPFHFSGYEDTPVLATLLIRQGNEVFRREIHQSEESFGLKS